MTKLKPGASRVGPKGTLFTTMNYIDAALQGSFSGASPPPEEGKALLHDMHKGIYRHHTSLRSMVEKAFRQVFYWPTAAIDMAHIVRSCRGC
jgi:hypothetical protein